MTKHIFTFEQSVVDSESHLGEVVEIIIPATDITLPDSVEHDITAAINTLRDDAVTNIEQATNILQNIANVLNITIDNVYINTAYPITSGCSVNYNCTEAAIIKSIETVSGISSITEIRLNNNVVTLPVTVNKADVLTIFFNSTATSQQLLIKYQKIAETKTIDYTSANQIVSTYKFVSGAGIYNVPSLNKLLVLGSVRSYLMELNGKIYDYLSTYLYDFAYNYPFCTYENKLFLNNTAQNNAVFYNLLTKTTGSNITLPGAYRMGVYGNNKVYISYTTGSISIINAISEQIEATITHPTYSSLYGIAYYNGLVYAVNYTYPRLVAYNIEARSWILDLGIYGATNNIPLNLAINTQNKKLIICYYGTSANRIVIVDIDPESPTYHKILTTIIYSPALSCISVYTRDNFAYIFSNGAYLKLNILDYTYQIINNNNLNQISYFAEYENVILVISGNGYIHKLV